MQVAIHAANDCMKPCKNLRVPSLKVCRWLEELVGAADIGLGLLPHRHVQKHQRLPQVMVGAEAADGTGRYADHAELCLLTSVGACERAVF